MESGGNALDFLKVQVKVTSFICIWQAKRSINREELVCWHEQFVLMDTKTGFKAPLHSCECVLLVTVVVVV